MTPPHLSRSFLYLLIALAVGFLAIGIDLQAIIQTQTELNYAAADELRPTNVLAKNPAVVRSEADTSGLSLSNVEGWKTYRNEEYGFEFKYPPGALLERTLSGVSLTRGEHGRAESPSLSILVEENSDRLSVGDYYDGSPGRDLHGQSTPPDGPALIEGLTVAGVAAVRFTPYVSFAGETDIVLSMDGWYLRVVDIGSTFLSDGSLDQILSTFKLIDKIDTSTWKTYRNEEYGFEFKYPSGVVVTREEDSIHLVKTIPWHDSDPCNMVTNEKIDTITAFDLLIDVVPKDLRATDIEKSRIMKLSFQDDGSVDESSSERYIAGANHGYRTVIGVEGSGDFQYYFPLSSSATLFAFQRFCWGVGDVQGWDSPLADQIFSTLKFMK